MYLTITSTASPATDLGYLLHKHPGRAQSIDLPVGRGHVFYPEATPQHCTVALLLEIDPIGLVRGKRSPGRISAAHSLRQRPALHRLVNAGRGTELLPWSAKAEGLLREQYAPVGAAADAALPAAMAGLQQAAAAGVELSDLLGRIQSRATDAEAFTAAYRRYC